MFYRFFFVIIMILLAATNAHATSVNLEIQCEKKRTYFQIPKRYFYVGMGILTAALAPTTDAKTCRIWAFEKTQCCFFKPEVEVQAVFPIVNAYTGIPIVELTNCTVYSNPNPPPGAYMDYNICCEALTCPEPVVCIYNSLYNCTDSFRDGTIGFRSPSATQSEKCYFITFPPEKRK